MLHVRLGGGVHGQQGARGGARHGADGDDASALVLLHLGEHGVGHCVGAGKQAAAAWCSFVGFKANREEALALSSSGEEQRESGREWKRVEERKDIPGDVHGDKRVHFLRGELVEVLWVIVRHADVVDEDADVVGGDLGRQLLADVSCYCC